MSAKLPTQRQFGPYINAKQCLKFLEFIDATSNEKLLTMNGCINTYSKVINRLNRSKVKFYRPADPRNKYGDNSNSEDDE